jgi:hypothetical protein
MSPREAADSFWQIMVTEVAYEGNADRALAAMARQGALAPAGAMVTVTLLNKAGKAVAPGHGRGATRAVFTDAATGARACLVLPTSPGSRETISNGTCTR